MKFSKEEKMMWVADWKQSGKSAWAYAKMNGLNQQTFTKWTKFKQQEEQCLVEIPSVLSTERVMKSAVSLPEILIERGHLKIHIPLVINHSDLRAIFEGLGALI